MRCLRLKTLWQRFLRAPALCRALRDRQGVFIDRIHVVELEDAPPFASGLGVSEVIC